MKTITFCRPNTMQSAMSDFDRYFGTFFGDSLLNQTSRAFGRMPQVDVRETEKAYVMEMELPGYDEKDIEISIDGNRLSVASKQGEAQGEDGGDQGTWLIRERRTQAFSRSFKIPENANPEEVTAEFRNGVLFLEVQKRAEAQKRTIRINAK